MPITAVARLARLVALTGLLCSAGLAQIEFSPAAPRSAPLQPAAPLRTVTGTVFNTVTNEPVPRALVRVTGPDTKTAFSAPDGRFEIANIPEGTVQITAQRPGYVDSRMSPQNEARLNFFTVSSGSNDFRVPLVPESVIEGNVTDQDGTPVEGANIQLFHQFINEGRLQWQGGEIAPANDNGRYRFEDVPPGTVMLYAQQKVLGRMAWNAPAQVYPGMFYPASRELASAQPMDLKPGQTARADFVLTAVAGHRVSGTISPFDRRGGAVFFTKTEVGQQFLPEQPSMDPRTGKFTLDGVPDGSWTFIVSGSGQGKPLQATLQVGISGADVQGLSVVLQAGVDIPVQITHAPPAGESGTVNGMGLQAKLVGAAGFDEQYANQQGPPVANAEPKLSFLNVAPGQYRLQLAGFGPECVGSAFSGGVDLGRNPLVVTPGSVPEPIAVTMRNDCATLSLHVNGNAASATVLILPEDGLLQPIQTALFGGATSVQPLSPGTYHVYAFSDIGGLEYANPQAMRDFAGQTIELSPNQKSEVTLDVIERKHP